MHVRNRILTDRGVGSVASAVCWTGSRLFHHRGKHLFHRQSGSAAGQRNLLLAAVRPDGMRDAAERRHALVITLLVAVVDGDAGENSVAVVFVGADGAYADVGRSKGLPTVRGLREERVGLEAEAGGVVPSIVKRYVNVACDWIHSHPVIEAIHREGKLIRHGRRP